MKKKIKNLKREKLVEILCKVADILPKEQYLELEKMIVEAATDNSIEEKCPVMVRMSQELVDEKLEQIKGWMRQIEEDQRSENRAEDLFLYFGIHAFQKLHIEEIFHVGREQLAETEQFWKDWISLLKTKRGDVAGRLLQEAVLYCEGIHGLINIADENANVHPMLYLTAMKEYDKKHEYSQIETIGHKAVEKIDYNMVIRSKIALKAAFAADCLGHTEEMMAFCWEGFRSDSTDKNFLRLFGMKEMAEKYGLKGKDIIHNCKKGKAENSMRDIELQQNFLGDYSYLKM